MLRLVAADRAADVPAVAAAAGPEWAALWALAIPSVALARRVADARTAAHALLQAAWAWATDGPVAEAVGAWLDARWPADHLLAPTARTERERGGATRRVLRGHQGPVLRVLLHPDGRRAVSAGRDHTVRVWCLGTGQCLAVCRGHADTIRGLALLRGGRRAVTVSEDGGVRVWSLRTGRCLRVWTEDTRLTALAVLPGGRRIAVGGADAVIRIRNVPEGTLEAELRGHQGEITSLSVRHDGLRLVSGGAVRRGLLWDLTTMRCLRLLKTRRGHHGPVDHVGFTPDGRYVLTFGGGIGGVHSCVQVRLWSSDGVPRGVFDAGAATRAFAMTPDSAGVVVAAGDRLYGTSSLHRVVLAPTRDGQLLGNPWFRRRAVNHGQVHRLLADPSSEHFLSACEDGTACVLDHEGQVLVRLHGHTGAVRDAAWRPEEATAVTASADGTLRVWDLARAERRDSSVEHAAAIERLVVTPDGRRALSAARDGAFWIWDAASGARLAEWSPHGLLPSALEVHPDGVRVLMSTADRSCTWSYHNFAADVRHLLDGRRLALLAGHKAAVSAIAVHPAGRLVATGDLDGTVAIWDLSDVPEDDYGGECRVATIVAHSGPIRSLLWAPAAGLRRLVTAGHDARIRVWDIGAAGGARTRLELDGHPRGGVTQLRWWGDELVSADSGGDICVWERGGEGALGRLRTGAGVSGLCVGPEGLFVARRGALEVFAGGGTRLAWWPTVEEVGGVASAGGRVVAALGRRVVPLSVVTCCPVRGVLGRVELAADIVRVRWHARQPRLAVRIEGGLVHVFEWHAGARHLEELERRTGWPTWAATDAAPPSGLVARTSGRVLVVAEE